MGQGHSSRFQNKKSFGWYEDGKKEEKKKGRENKTGVV
jgi:hypothetical protein